MQNAYDRDDYVQIKWENVREGAENNFFKYNSSYVSHFGEKYDYYSVMHYNAYVFSKNKNPTIMPFVSVYFIYNDAFNLHLFFAD